MGSPYLEEKRQENIHGKIEQKETFVWIEEVVAIDKKNRNTLCQDATEKDMENVKIAFQIIPKSEKASNGYQYVYCHLVFNIKREVFFRNACLVVGGHMTLTWDVISIFTRETVHTALSIAELRG